MSNDPLEDFNRRTTAGSGSWMQGPPTNAAESTAQTFIDQRGAGKTGGGSIDFGVRISAIIVLLGVLLFAGGAHIADNFHEAAAMTGLLVVLVSGFLLLVGVGGLVVGIIKDMGSANGWRNLLIAALAALVTWWFSPWLWMMSSAVLPKGLMPVAAAALVFVFAPQR